MKKINTKNLIKILIILSIILLLFIIIRELKIIGFCCTILNLVSPVFIGFVIAWILKPIMKYFNKRFNVFISTSITYILLSIILVLISYFLFPILIKEIKNLIPSLINIYKELDYKLLENININEIGKKALLFINNCTTNIKNILLNIFYSLFISFYFLTNNIGVSKFISKYIPSKLINNLSVNLKAFVRGTLLDTIILFILSFISFKIINMPYFLLFAILVSITNLIPFIGPYIGGIPAILVCLSVSKNLALSALVIIIITQFIESSFIHPIIMSKALKINPIVLIIGLIIFGYFFGIIGMLLSTPILSIIKTLYIYYKEFPKKQILGK